MNTDLVLAAMQQKHVSPDQLATSCSVSRSTIERILDGQTTNPGILTMSGICVSLDLSLDDIMDMPRSAPPGAAGVAHSAELSNLYRAVIHVKDGWIKRLSIACAVLVCFDMFYWIIDLANISGGVDYYPEQHRGQHLPRGNRGRADIGRDRCNRDSFQKFKNAPTIADGAEIIDYFCNLL